MGSQQNGYSWHLKQTTVLVPTIQAVSRCRQTSLPHFRPYLRSSAFLYQLLRSQTYFHMQGDAQALHLRGDPELGDSGEKRPVPQLSELTLWVLSTTNPPKGVWVIQCLPPSCFSECFCLVSPCASLLSPG